MKLVRQSARNQQYVLVTRSYNWIHRQSQNDAIGFGLNAKNGNRSMNKKEGSHWQAIHIEVTLINFSPITFPLTV